MKKSLELDVRDLTTILETFTTKAELLDEAELIDLAARLKPAEKAIKEILELCKSNVKTKLRHKPGERLGQMFKAVLTLVPTTRLDQKALKEDEPLIHEAYCKECTDERVTFTLR